MRDQKVVSRLSELVRRRRVDAGGCCFLDGLRVQVTEKRKVTEEQIESEKSKRWNTSRKRKREGEKCSQDEAKRW